MPDGPHPPPDPCPWCGPPTTVLRVDSMLRRGATDGQPDAWAAVVICRSCAAEGPWAKADTRKGAESSAWRSWSRRWDPATGRIA